MQHDAIHALYACEPQVRALNDSGVTRAWRRLQTSDHFYYMCTKWFSDGDVHKYFNPYGSPYDAYINFMNVLADFKLRLNARHDGRADATKGNGTNNAADNEEGGETVPEKHTVKTEAADSVNRPEI